MFNSDWTHRNDIWMVYTILVGTHSHCDLNSLSSSGERTNLFCPIPLSWRSPALRVRLPERALMRSVGHNLTISCTIMWTAACIWPCYQYDTHPLAPAPPCWLYQRQALLDIFELRSRLRETFLGLWEMHRRAQGVLRGCRRICLHYSLSLQCFGCCNALRAVLTQNLIVGLLQTLEQCSSCAEDEHWHSLQPTTNADFVLLSSTNSWKEKKKKLERSQY